MEHSAVDLLSSNLVQAETVMFKASNLVLGENIFIHKPGQRLGMLIEYIVLKLIGMLKNSYNVIRAASLYMTWLCYRSVCPLIFYNTLVPII